MAGTCVFHFLVFVQAGFEWITLAVNTVTKILAPVWAATVPAPVRAFKLRISGPDVVQKLIDDNHGQDCGENKNKKQNRELAGLFQDVIFIGPKRQDVFQPVPVPNQQEQVRQQHERGDAGSFKPDGIGQHTDVQNDGEVEDRAQKGCSWNEQQKRRY